MVQHIVRVNLRAGESFSTLAPHPLFTIADLSARRVRAEVDERDIRKVRVGQKVFLTSEAFPGKHFEGSVARFASIMGRKPDIGRLKSAGAAYCSSLGVTARQRRRQ